MQLRVSATLHEAQQRVRTEFKNLGTNYFPHLRHKALGDECMNNR